MPSPKLLHIVGIVILLIMSLAYVGRSWIRLQGFPAVATVVAKQSINSALDRSLASAWGAGIVIDSTNKDSLYSGASLCGSGKESEGFYVSASCSRGIIGSLNPLHSDPYTRLEEIAQSMKTQGWATYQIEIPGVSVEPNQLQLRRQYGSVDCQMSFSFRVDRLPVDVKTPIRASILCHRNIELFGRR